MKFAAAWLGCLLLLTPVLRAQYDRVLYSGKGESHAVSSSHPLSYWTADPLARDDGGDLCLGCKTQDGKVVGKQNYQVTVDQHRLGTLAGHEIVEMIYHVHGDVAEFGESSVWRIILAGTKPAQYAEIYHLQNAGIQYVQPAPGVNEQQFQPSRIVAVGKESILATYEPDGGNGGGCWEGYWWFNAAGPHSVDFDPVYKAIGEKAPKHSTYTVGCWTIDLDQHQIHTNVQKINAECRACGQLGTATADFEIIHGVAKATHVEFELDEDQ